MIITIRKIKQRALQIFSLVTVAGNVLPAAIFAMALLISFGASLTGTPRVNADAPVTTAVQTYCLAHIPSAARTACEGTTNANVTHAYNAASYHCQNTSTANGAQSNCVQTQ